MARRLFSNWMLLGIASLGRKVAFRLPPRGRRVLLDRVVQVRTRDGYCFFSRLRDLPSVAEVFMGGEYDRLRLPWPACNHLLDCGANVGAFSIWALQHGVHRVTSVEPAASTWEVLRRTCDLVGPRLQTLNAALGAADGTATFAEAEESTASALVNGNRDRGAYSVRMRSLSSLLTELGDDPVDALKLDVEGAEGAVIEATPITDLQDLKLITLEIHRSKGIEPEPIVAKLRQGGREVHVFDRGHAVIVFSLRPDVGAAGPDGG